MDKLIFVNKSWPHDLKVHVDHLSLIELIEFDVDLEEDLNKYEGKFERNEILDLWIYP